MAKRLNFNKTRLEEKINFFMIKEKKENLIIRPPVVVVLGHVDSGKTSILDYIRKTHITEKEAGGITQHIGAYEIAVSINKQEERNKKITFVDTPGHEAFSQMRSRGAKVADIAILVVDSTQGVKAQTKEAINHIKKSQIPIIVAINKIDRPEANPEKVKNELSKNDVLVEQLGGKVPSIEISAKTGKGIDQLLELILLVAEIEELKGDISKPGQGVVIESYLDNQRGPTATLILEDGSLKKGDIIGTSSTLGRIKILEDFQGRPIKKALASMPIIIIGFESVPLVGEKFRQYPDIETSQKFIKKREKIEQKQVLFDENKRVLNLILKADVLGSLEAIEGVLENLPQEKVQLQILKKEVGEISESDLKLARASRAKILGFRVKTNPQVLEMANREKIKIMTFEVIYDLVEGVREIMERLIKPKIIRIEIGKVKISIVFKTEKNRQIIGGKVLKGEVKKGVLIEVLHNEEIAGKGRLINLQVEKKDVERVKKGKECGILYEGNAKIEEGDILIIYTEEKRKEKL
jgi:translation initiation factor IF-2